MFNLFRKTFVVTLNETFLNLTDFIEL